MKSLFSNEFRKPVRADFQLHVDEPAREIRIIDEDLGAMSVTNDLEAVLREVSLQVDAALPDYSIIYRDSTGTWDRIVVKAHETLAHTWNFEVLPGPREPQETRDMMAPLKKSMT